MKKSGVLLRQATGLFHNYVLAKTATVVPAKTRFRFTEFMKATEHIDVDSFCSFDVPTVYLSIGNCSGLAKQPAFLSYDERFNRALSAIIINL